MTKNHLGRMDRNTLMWFRIELWQTLHDLYDFGPNRDQTRQSARAKVEEWGLTETTARAFLRKKLPTEWGQR